MTSEPPTPGDASHSLPLPLQVSLPSEPALSLPLERSATETPRRISNSVAIEPQPYVATAAELSLQPISVACSLVEVPQSPGGGAAVVSGLNVFSSAEPESLAEGTDKTVRQWAGDGSKETPAETRALLEEYLDTQAEQSSLSNIEHAERSVQITPLLNNDDGRNDLYMRLSDDDRDELDLLASQIEDVGHSAVFSSPHAASLPQNSPAADEVASPSNHHAPFQATGESIEASACEGASRSPVPAAPESGPAPSPPQPPHATPASEIPQELLQPSPPRRALRSRKPGQLNPYTIEMAMYKRRLERNDWEDAVVTDRQFRRRIREERERAAADELPVDGSDWQLRQAEAEERRQRRKAKKQLKERDQEVRAISPTTVAQSRADGETSAPRGSHGGSKRRRLESSPAPDQAAMFARFGGLMSDDDEAASQQPAGENAAARTYKRGRTKGRFARRTSEGSSGSSSRETAPPRASTHRQMRRVSSAGAIHIFSSEEEDSHPPQLPHRNVRQNSIGSTSSTSSEESVDYDRYFRQLKKMMPIHMARKYIDDLKNMRKGKAYHSDGHISATPEPSVADSGSESDAEVNATTPATSPMRIHELQPGEARKRIRPAGDQDGVRDDARFDLVGDETSESSDGALSVASISSSSSAHSGQVAGGDADIRWWTRPELNPFSGGGTRVRPGHVDEVDRMLSRSATARTRRRRRPRATAPYQARSEGVARSRFAARSERDPARNPLQTRTLNSQQRSKYRISHRKQQVPQSSRPPSHRLPPRRRGSNPPVVHPRVLRKLDLMTDDVLFDVELLQPDLQHDHGKDNENVFADSQHAIASYKAVNRPNQPIARRKQKPSITAAYDYPPLAPEESTSHLASVTHAAGREFGRNSSRSSIEAPSPISAINRRSPARRQGCTVQQLLDPRENLSRSGQAEPIRKSPSPHQLDANAWADLANLRLDFGIRPLAAGTSFAPTTNLGKGRLHELVNLPHEQNLATQAWTRLRAIHNFGLQLPATTDPDVLLELLPSIFDGIFTAIESIASGDDGTPRIRASLEEVLRYLSLTISALLRVLLWREVKQVAIAVQNQLDHIFERFQSAGIGSERVNETSAQQTASSMLALRWFNVEVCWRTVASRSGTEVDCEDMMTEEEEFVLACQSVIVSLLSHGLHQTWGAVSRACVAQPLSAEADGSEGQPHEINDYSAEIWVYLIHLLNTAATVLGPHAGFWNVFEAGLMQWKATLPPRRKVLTAEMIWYTILSLCALSQFSASTGTSGSTPLLTQHWPLVVQALTVTKLRYDENVEQAMPSAAICKRDQYIRAVLQRCFNLVSLWKWSLEGADAALSKLFDIFNDHKLADLPSEEDHDFPPFLREYDARLLFEESKREATSYHIFLKLLARAGRDLQASAQDARDAERRVARLFSRVCPVRVMSFTRASPPTSRERSSLFNHYAVVMTHLYLVPSAGAQRLRQIKSFLVFKHADAQSQVTCIRAMLYAAVIFRHYNLEISSISAWFSTIFKTLVADAEEVDRLSAKQEPGHHFEVLRQARRVNSLLVTSLRSIQHIIEHPGLREEGTLTSRPAAEPLLPDVLLLDRSWTSEILESQTAIDPAVGMEVLKCIQVCLLQRKECMDSIVGNNRPPVSRNLARDFEIARIVGESQDSFGDPFEGEGDDGFDFSDPALDLMLGDSAAAAEREERLAVLRQADMALAQHLRDNISPSFFRLISNIYHPDRHSEGRRISLGLSDTLRETESVHYGGRQHLENLLKRTTRRRYLELLIDCWAGCAHVLVQNGLRDWNGYLTYGNESWKRLVDATGKRDVGLRFLQNVAVLDPSAYHSHQTEFLQVWFQSAAARSLSIQADFTRTLFEEIEPNMPWLRTSLAHIRSEGVERGEEAGMTLDVFLRHRTFLVTSAVSEMARDFSSPDHHADTAQSKSRAQRRGMVFSCLSGFLSAMRSQLEVLPAHPPRQRPDVGGDGDSTSVDRYLVFCQETTQAISSLGGPTILRGVKGELDRTVALLTRTGEARKMPLTTVLGF